MTRTSSSQAIAVSSTKPPSSKIWNCRATRKRTKVVYGDCTYANRRNDGGRISEKHCEKRIGNACWCIHTYVYARQNLKEDHSCDRCRMGEGLENDGHGVVATVGPKPNTNLGV